MNKIYSYIIGLAIGIMMASVIIASISTIYRNHFAKLDCIYDENETEIIYLCYFK